MAGGLGDTVEWITVKTGIKKIVPKNCGCEKRKKWLNEKITFKKNVPSNEDAIRVAEEQVKEVLTSNKKK